MAREERNLDVSEMRFDGPAERTDVPRPARLSGPNDFGLSSRIDVYRHDGADENGDEYADRVSFYFDDAMLERAARAWPLPGPPIGDDFNAHLKWRKECAEIVLRAALTPDE